MARVRTAITALTAITDLTAPTVLTVLPVMSKLTPSGGRQILRLKIGDIPKNPFVGQDFLINVHLVDDSGKLKCGCVALTLTLCTLL